jgi:hypothetical protein
MMGMNEGINNFNNMLGGNNNTRLSYKNYARKYTNISPDDSKNTNF